MKFGVVVLGLVFLTTCSLPVPEKLDAFVSFSDFELTADSLSISIKKEIAGPIHSYISSKMDSLDKKLQDYNPIILTDSMREFSFSIAHQELDTSSISQSIRINNFFGDPTQMGTPLLYAWPFPKGKTYKIIQGYNGSFSHQSKTSKYAIDFNLQVGDTVCAAQDGLVVSVLHKNTIGGSNRKYRPYANYISVYHSDGLFSQYVHLKPNSAFVKPGDQVKKGQAIGLSGKTGFTDGPHLHFNVYKPIIGDAISTPIEFEQMPGSKLTKGRQVSH
jgi:murein DD-endopeptidase MepM/ murein hydrolase activator NlpD